jgi:hypothetical protein
MKIYQYLKFNIVIRKHKTFNFTIHNHKYTTVLYVF